MSVGEFTSSNIAASMDVEKDEGPGTDSADLKELQSQIAKQKQLAKEVGCWNHLGPGKRVLSSLSAHSKICCSFNLCYATQGRRTEAVEALLNLEKQHRLAENVTLTKACCLAVLDVLFEAQQWKELNEHILLLAKRRSQLKQVRVRVASFSIQKLVCAILHPR